MALDVADSTAWDHGDPVGGIERRIRHEEILDAQLIGSLLQVHISVVKRQVGQIPVPTVASHSAILTAPSSLIARVTLLRLRRLFSQPAPPSAGA